MYFLHSCYVSDFLYGAQTEEQLWHVSIIWSTIWLQYLLLKLMEVTHLSEGGVWADSSVHDISDRTTRRSVQEQVIRSYDVRLSCTANSSITIIDDLCQITVSVVVAIIASCLSHVQPYTLCKIIQSEIQNILREEQMTILTLNSHGSG